MEFDRFGGFDWDAGNIDKCQGHGMTCREVESVFVETVLIMPDKPNAQGERRLRAVGFTEGGRWAFVAFTMRGAAIRPISARYMHKREVNYYEKAYPQLRDR